MTFVTKLRLQSGDRAALDGVVEDIRSTAERKGAELKGPHSEPPTQLRVPQHKRVDGGGRFGNWEYVVYARELEIHGHDELARRVTEREFPASIHVEAEVEQVNPLGSGRD
ncbi:uS10/mL48 family ribosomal protein [Halostella litorea]|uniref:uS10/mL48 family ribosomal protein n=1 Tax=Halostella litorea TaxID=2528831 RepID=UPI001092CE12|nr:uS10/mL48 family ribosomal protein [Halostella litorea]